MRTRILGVALAAFASLLAPAPAQAAARVFVSVFGSDAGDCSNRSTPCRTFGAAITQVDAGGEVIVIDTGSYGGATISKSVKLNVPVGVVAFTASAMTVAAGASDVVVLRGLTIKALTPGTGNGILFTSGAALHVENCVLDGWQHGIFVNPTVASKVFVIDTLVRNSGFDGLRIDTAGGIAKVSVDNSRFENNSVCGVDVVTGDASILRSVATANAGGFCALEGGTINVEGSLAAYNSDVGLLASFGVMRATKCIVTGNETGFSNSLGTFESLGDNLVRGNTTNTVGSITAVAGQ
jgi:hypothetical protein